MSFSFSIHPGRGRWAVSQKLKLIRTLHMGEGVGEGIMLMYRCALFTKYCRGDVVARVPSVPTNVERESLKRCLMWVECLACVQTSPPLPQEKSGEESLLPIFSEEGDVCTQAIECLVSPLLLREIFLRVLWFPPLLKNHLFKFQFDSQWKVKNHSANV